MSGRVSFLAIVCLAALNVSGRADIYRWDTGELIPGTENITPGPSINLSGWNTPSRNLKYADFSGIDLSATTLTSSDLTGAAFFGANFTNVDISDAVIDRAHFAGTRDFAPNQLYSTRSYQEKNLNGINLGDLDLSGWNFDGQSLKHASFNGAELNSTQFVGANLTNTDFERSSLLETNFSGADLRNADFTFAISSIDVVVSSETKYNQWTRTRLGFLDAATFLPSQLGDVDADDDIDEDDLDYIRNWLCYCTLWSTWREPLDFNEDNVTDVEDYRFWVKDIKNTYFGDANLDGQFDSTDLVQVFQSGQYEDAFENNSGWSRGDWNADGEFTSSDLVVAFQDGGYEAGTRAGMVAVPEPTCIGLLMMGVCGMRGILRSRTVR